MCLCIDIRIDLAVNGIPPAAINLGTDCSKLSNAKVPKAHLVDHVYED